MLGERWWQRGARPKGEEGIRQEKSGEPGTRNKFEPQRRGIHDYLWGNFEIRLATRLRNFSSGSTSHICTTREAFTDFTAVNETLNGVGEKGTAVLGRGTVSVRFEVDGKEYVHHLHNTLYTPNAPNCLISLSRLDDAGGKVEFDKGMCWIRNKDGMVVGTGRKHHRLYLLVARAILTKEKANLATTGKHTWDQWHRRYGHISVTTLRQLEKEGLVNGLAIDQSSFPSKTCDACTQAKQAHQPFPQEAEN